MKAIVKQIQGNTFAAKADSGHWITIDTSTNDGGSAGASSPVEMVLMALGACSAMDVVLMLNKMRANVIAFHVNLDAERAEDYPRVFTKVKMEYVLSGKNIKPRDVERAIQLSIAKYCTVAGMLGKTAEIETTYKIMTESLT
ncbi:MAG TPA: OsmC family protein [bacterium]